MERAFPRYSFDRAESIAVSTFFLNLQTHPLDLN